MPDAPLESEPAAAVLLCLDTSDGAVVALCRGTEVLASRRSPDARRHAETLAPMIAEVLAAAGTSAGDLTGIAVGTGPAPFTGLRVGLVTARTMGQALGVPVHGVCSLDALARQALDAPDAGEILVATDARRREVYWAHYRAAGHDDAERLTGPDVTSAAELAERFGALVAAGAIHGRGVALYPEHLNPGGTLPPDATAAVVQPETFARIVAARLETGGDLATAARYLRRPDIHTAPGRKRTS